MDSDKRQENLNQTNQNVSYADEKLLSQLLRDAANRALSVELVHFLSENAKNRAIEKLPKG